MKRVDLRFAAALALPLVVAAAPPAKPKPASPAPHVQPSRVPRVDLDKLNARAPGWVAVGTGGDATAGSQEYARDVWPVTYLHWLPMAEGAPHEISIEDASKLVSGLWEGFTIDGPLEGRKVALPQHEAVLFETTTMHGEMKTRYLVWACPESLRMLVVDLSLSLTANAPDALLKWQSDIARTVRCHASAPLEEFPHLPARYDIPGADLSYAHPQEWMPVPGYKAQVAFDGTDLSAARRANSAESGQDLILAADAVEHLHVSWEPEPDYPMSYDVLRQKVAEHWQSRAADLMITGTKVSGNVWIADGLARRLPEQKRLHLHLADWFRAWMWRKDGVTYFAVGQNAGVRFARRDLRLSREEREGLFDRMFEAIQY